MSAKTYSAFFIGTVCLALVTLGWYYFRPDTPAPTAVISTALSSPGAAASSRLVGGIAPHHLLVREHILTFLDQLHADFPASTDLVVLLPNHHEKGSTAPIIPVNDQDFWHSQATDSAFLYPADPVIASEESVGAWQSLVQASRYSWRLRPVLISAATSGEDFARLRALIRDLARSGIPFIASVDFSHYRSRSQAEIFDARTRNAMSSYRLDEIALYSNDHVDSPVILALSVTLAQTENWTYHWYWHANSADFQPETDDGNTTSYYIIGLKTQLPLDKTDII